MRKTVTGLLLSSLLALGLAGTPATADSWKWRDRSGGRGPLSITSVTAGHVDRYGQSIPTLTITFDRRLDPGGMGRDDFIVVDVDADGRGKSEEWIYFVGVGGRLRRFSYHPASDGMTEVSGGFSRPTPRSLKIEVTRHAPGWSHAFVVATHSKTGSGCGGGCWDLVPNRGTLIHDWTPPQIKGVVEPSSWTLTPTFRFYWEALDEGLSGFRHSTLFLSEAGSGTWRKVATRRREGKYRIDLTTRQGSHMMFRAVAQDGALNTVLSELVLTRVPYDQANRDAPGTFTGAWTETPVPGAYGGTVHTSTAPLDALTFSRRGNTYCVLARWGPEPTRARLEAGGQVIEIGNMGGATSAGEPPCVTTDAVEAHEATLTVEVGRLQVDGYWAGVVGEWTRAGTPRGRELVHYDAAPLVPSAGHGVSRLPLSRFRGAVPRT